MKKLLKRALRRKASVFAACLLALIILMAIFAPLVTSVDPNAQELILRLKPPGWSEQAIPGHPLGTDHLGRDVWARIVYGSRVSLSVGLQAAGVAAAIGITLGLISGFFGGAVGNLIMRVAEVQLAIPGILLALVLVAVLGPSLHNLIIVLGISGWVTYARITRAQVLTLREMDFVTSAKAIGAGTPRVFIRYLLPNLWGSLIVVWTMQVAGFILSEASLSFLGLGVPLSTPTWGGMLNDGQLHIATAWWVSAFPGVAIILTVLSINLVGDMLRDLLDPKMRQI